jgi:hypothetical protein
MVWLMLSFAFSWGMLHMPIRFPDLFAASGAVFQTNDKFEHIPFLAHTLNAYPAIETSLFV